MTLTERQIDQVPWLRRGSGDTPAQGGCIMQVVDWIDRREWTDDPPCVHPYLVNVAVWINDRVGKEERQGLLDLVPRLMGTSKFRGDKELEKRFEKTEVAAGSFHGVPLNKITPWGPKSVGEPSVDLLSALLDVYDEYTGRTYASDVDLSVVPKALFSG